VSHKDASVLKALDTLLDGRTRKNWLSLPQVVEELTESYNQNPIILRSGGISARTFVQWHEYVSRNQARGFTIADVARLLEGQGYQRGFAEVGGVRVPVFGGRK
jgi:hypothetical protein